MEENIGSLKIKQFVKELTTNATPTERRLRNYFSSKRIKFEFQYPVRCKNKTYILDFLVFVTTKTGKKEKWAIELDGKHHHEQEKAEYDAKRTEELNKKGIKVIRFDNYEVNGNFTGVARKIFSLGELETGVLKHRKGKSKKKVKITKSRKKVQYRGKSKPKKERNSFGKELDKINDKEEILTQINKRKELMKVEGIKPLEKTKIFTEVRLLTKKLQSISTV